MPPWKVEAPPRKLLPEEVEIWGAVRAAEGAKPPRAAGEAKSRLAKAGFVLGLAAEGPLKSRGLTPGVDWPRPPAAKLVPPGWLSKP